MKEQTPYDPVSPPILLSTPSFSRSYPGTTRKLKALFGLSATKHDQNIASNFRPVGPERGYSYSSEASSILQTRTPTEDRLPVFSNRRDWEREERERVLRMHITDEDKYDLEKRHNDSTPLNVHSQARSTSRASAPRPFATLVSTGDRSSNGYFDNLRPSTPPPASPNTPPHQSKEPRSPQLTNLSYALSSSPSTPSSVQDAVDNVLVSHSSVSSYSRPKLERLGKQMATSKTDTNRSHDVCSKGRWTESIKQLVKERSPIGRSVSVRRARNEDLQYFADHLHWPTRLASQGKDSCSNRHRSNSSSNARGRTSNTCQEEKSTHPMLSQVLPRPPSVPRGRRYSMPGAFPEEIAPQKSHVAPQKRSYQRTSSTSSLAKDNQMPITIRHRCKSAEPPRSSTSFPEYPRSASRVRGTPDNDLSAIKEQSCERGRPRHRYRRPSRLRYEIYSIDKEEKLRERVLTTESIPRKRESSSRYSQRQKDTSTDDEVIIHPSKDTLTKQGDNNIPRNEKSQCSDSTYNNNKIPMKLDYTLRPSTPMYKSRSSKAYRSQSMRYVAYGRYGGYAFGNTQVATQNGMVHSYHYTMDSRHADYDDYEDPGLLDAICLSPREPLSSISSA